MKNINLILILASLFIALSCRQDKTEKGVSHCIDISGTSAEEVRLSRLAGDLRYIFLEKRPGDLIGRIDKIIFDENHIYLLDSKGSKSVHIFDHRGGWINSLSDRGRGPGEFIMPKDISLDRDGKELILYCSNLKKFLAFSSTGEFQREWPSQLWLDRFEFAGAGRYIAFTNYKYNTLPDYPNLSYDLIQFDERNRITGTFLPNSVEKNFGRLTFSFGRHFFGDHNELYFSHTFADTLYRIEKENVVPAFFLDFGNDRIPEYKKDDVKSLVNQINGGRYSCFVSLEIIGEVAFITYLEKGETRFLIYDRLNGQVINLHKVVNDIDDAPFKVPLASWNGHLVTVLYPDEMLQIEGGKKVLLKGVSTAVESSDNPILMLIELKPEKLFKNEI